MIEYLIVFLPLFGALLSGCFVRFESSIFLQIVCTVCTVCTSIASVLSWVLFFTLKDVNLIQLFPWISIGEFKSNFSIRVDRLSSLMFLVVTTVSSIVHIYSIGYMAHDKHKSRFFAYLSLFTFAMLVLVSAEDLLQLFLGWEGVGLCSYLLIGFWFNKESANLASMKAFIVNRVGDFCFLVGIFSVYSLFGTISVSQISSVMLSNNVFDILGQKILHIDAITFICMALFLGAMSKSAQIGLHTWLPDAMEGPTPVSALIHAATMVTAGVFLVVKMSFLFEYSSFARTFVLTVGAITSIFAGSIAVFQSDIKKIIAYSTCSQLGYMFVACGASAYGIAMFHLTTHAFFKALLFLCAGNVIHSISDEQDITKMGGLGKRIKSTYYMMLIGSLALCGIFPLAGFYSKDLIIGAVSLHLPMLITTVLAAFLTSIYSFKIIFTVFCGNENFSSEKFHKLPNIMILPLGILSILSVISGFIGEDFLKITQESFWSGTNIIINETAKLHGVLHFLPIGFALLGIVIMYILRSFVTNEHSIQKKSIYLSYCLFITGCILLSGYFALCVFALFVTFALLDRNHTIFNKFISILKNKYYFDEIYDYIFVKSIRCISNFFWNIIDVMFVDFSPKALVWVSDRSSKIAEKFQTGYVYDYALLMIVGILLVYTLL